jgi:hypothetical protein
MIQRLERPGGVRALAQRVPQRGVMPAPQSKIGPVAPPNPYVATAPAPQADQGRAEVRTYVQTYFTKIGETQILYNGDRQWAKITLTLETAGPVAVGTAQKIGPALSGKGILLTTDEPITITVAKGTRLYVVSTSVNRVKMFVEALPWLEQITGLLRNFVGSIAGRLGR